MEGENGDLIRGGEVIKKEACGREKGKEGGTEEGARADER